MQWPGLGAHQPTRKHPGPQEAEGGPPLPTVSRAPPRLLLAESGPTAVTGRFLCLLTVGGPLTSLRTSISHRTLGLWWSLGIPEGAATSPPLWSLPALPGAHIGPHSFEEIHKALLSPVRQQKP